VAYSKPFISFSVLLSSLKQIICEYGSKFYKNGVILLDKNKLNKCYKEIDKQIINYIYISDPNFKEDDILYKKVSFITWQIFKHKPFRLVILKNDMLDFDFLININELIAFAEGRYLILEEIKKDNKIENTSQKEAFIQSVKEAITILKGSSSEMDKLKAIEKAYRRIS